MYVYVFKVFIVYSLCMYPLSVTLVSFFFLASVTQLQLCISFLWKSHKVVILNMSNENGKEVLLQNKNMKHFKD